MLRQHAVHRPRRGVALLHQELDTDFVDRNQRRLRAGKECHTQKADNQQRQLQAQRDGKSAARVPRLQQDNPVR